jgi:hypothetical protein
MSEPLDSVLLFGHPDRDGECRAEASGRTGARRTGRSACLGGRHRLALGANLRDVVTAMAPQDVLGAGVVKSDFVTAAKPFSDRNHGDDVSAHPSCRNLCRSGAAYRSKVDKPALRQTEIVMAYESCSGTPLILPQEGEYKSYSGTPLILEQEGEYKSYSGTPLILEQKGEYKSYSGEPLILPQEGEYKSYSGEPLILKQEGEYKSYSGEPLVLKQEGEYKSYSGTPLILEQTGEYQSWSGYPLIMKDNPTPFSSWLGLPVLTKW